MRIEKNLKMKFYRIFQYCNFGTIMTNLKMKISDQHPNNLLEDSQILTPC